MSEAGAQTRRSSGLRKAGIKDRRAAVQALVGSTIRAVEMDLIRETLEVCGGKRITAAKILGVSVRTLRNKVGRRPDGEGNPESCERDGEEKA